jgi:hypothetical protein
MGKGILRQYGTASIIVAGPALSLPHDISSAVGGDCDEGAGGSRICRRKPSASR